MESEFLPFLSVQEVRALPAGLDVVKDLPAFSCIHPEDPSIGPVPAVFKIHVIAGQEFRSDHLLRFFYCNCSEPPAFYCRTISALPEKAAVMASYTLMPCFLPVLRYDMILR